MTLRYLALMAIALFGVYPACAAVVTTFDEASLHPDVFLDVPNGALASITFDSANDELDFQTAGSTDLWVGRDNAPFAWTARPAVSLGESWIVETEVRFDTDVLTGKTRVAGITFYGGPDGTGGSSQGMDFTFGINNWDDRGDPGYVPAIEVQGLGDNAPGSGSNLTAPWALPSAQLRVVVTEGGAIDSYAFYYRATSVDPWIFLGALTSSVDNSRATLFLKTSGATAAPDRSAAFTFFNVFEEAVVPEIPVLDPRSLALLAGILVAAGVVALRR